jgi:hypothetical protein
MKIVVRKTAQGPALAKGNPRCGVVDAQGTKLGCEFPISRDSSITVGGDPRNGGSGAIQYSNNNCC